MAKTTKIERRRRTPYTRHIFLCTGDACGDREKNRKLWRHLKRRTSEPQLAHVERSQARCLRICEQGGIAVVYPEGTWYWRLDRAALDRIVDEHLVGGRPVEEFVFHRNPLGEGAPPSAPGGEDEGRRAPRTAHPRSPGGDQSM